MEFIELDVQATNFRLSNQNGTTTGTFLLCVPRIFRDGLECSFDVGQLKAAASQMAHGTAGMADALHLGQLLGDLLLPSTPSHAVRGFFEKQLVAARNQRKGLRLRLILDTALQAWPWEFMLVNLRGQEPTSDDFLALQPDVSIVRHLWSQYPCFETVIHRSLAAGFASPRGCPPLNLAHERSNLQTLLNNYPEISTHFIQPARRTDLSELPNGTRVFHFAGHGLLAEEMSAQPGQTEGVGAIVLENETGEADELDAHTLAACLRKAEVQAAVLGACEGAKRADVNQWSSVAESLIKGGLTAVVGMQFAIKDTSAIDFSSALYRALLKGETMDEAMCAGRLALHVQGDVRGFGTPVLYLQDLQGVPSKGVIFPKLSTQDLGTMSPLPPQVTQQGGQTTRHFGSVAIPSATPGKNIEEFVKPPSNPSSTPPRLEADPFPILSAQGNGESVHLMTDHAELFQTRQQFLIADTVVLPMLPGQVVPLSVFRSNGYGTVRLRVNPAGGLTLRSWKDQGPDLAIAKSSQAAHEWPDASYRWWFRRCDLNDTLILAREVVMSFGPEQVQAAWRIWHKREGMRAIYFLVLVGKPAA